MAAHTAAVTDTGDVDGAVSSVRTEGSLAPGGLSRYPPSPFTAEDKRHERGSSPPSPLLFTAVILPQSPSAPPPPVPIPELFQGKKAAERRAWGALGEEFHHAEALCVTACMKLPLVNISQWILDSIQI